MSAIVSSSARWVFSSSFISCSCWKRELYHSFSSLLLENGLLVQRETWEKKERRKEREEEGLFFSLFLPFLDDRLLIFFSRALFFSFLRSIKSKEWRRRRRRGGVGRGRASCVGWSRRDLPLKRERIKNHRKREEERNSSFSSSSVQNPPEKESPVWSFFWVGMVGGVVFFCFFSFFKKQRL